jgi:hypothetical protein
MLNKIITTKKSIEQHKLEEFWKSCNNPSQPRILWYPSAGNDYRDILEMTTERASKHNINILPEVFIHTDYTTNEKFVNLNCGIIHKDSRTLVKLSDKTELTISKEWRDKIKYEVCRDFVGSSEIHSEPTIFLLDMVIESRQLGTVTKPVLYFKFENINFFREVVLKQKLNITHFVKVREGCGFGGNRKSITFIYAFLGLIKTQYLLVDNEVHFADNEVNFNFEGNFRGDFRHNFHNFLTKDHNQMEEYIKVFNSYFKSPDNCDYKLNKITPAPITWSDMSVNIFEVTDRKENVSRNNLEKNLKMIGEGWGH